MTQFCSSKILLAMDGKQRLVVVKKAEIELQFFLRAGVSMGDIRQVRYAVSPLRFYSLESIS